jgi:hypothetical protein
MGGGGEVILRPISGKKPGFNSSILEYGRSESMTENSLNEAYN